MTGERLTVYGWIEQRGGGQVRAVVAAKSWREAAELSGMTLNYLRNYGSITSNDAELSAAKARPRTVLARPLNDIHAAYRP